MKTPGLLFMAPDSAGVAGLARWDFGLFLGPGEERGCGKPPLPGALLLRT